MNKASFLTELAGHLRVLAEQEQQDILNEYAQHIDMKIKKGMSEEEAIGDFGPVKELAAEILEAYHVNPEYGDCSRRKRVDLESAAQSAEKGLRNAGSLAKKAGKGISNAAKKASGRMREFFRWIGTPFHREPGKHVKGQKKFSCVSLLYGLWAVCVDLIRWCIRLCWNCFWICVAAGMGLGTVGVIFCFGTLLILCLQGYPLVGLTLMGLGGILSGGALTCLCWGLIRRKKQEEEPEEAEEEMESEDGEPEKEEDDDQIS
ncbi:DUF1700 domain-containing protein [Candidatus Merdisoma sp. HCP28S3_D10]|uniref:DUF1700 domain-containing protein n=1 Tax=unclassified Candidatus Merdisoma TaxID=3099611 RepID=UPI003F8BED64